MRFWSKKAKIYVLLVIAVIGWTYKVCDRQLEVRSFFTNPDDLIWGRKYIDQTIDFCNDTSLGKTIIDDNQGREVYSSPSRRYEIQCSDTYHAKGMIFNGESFFSIIDKKNDRSQKNSKFLFRLPGYKWTKDERFLMFYLEDWWIFPKIFIVDISTGKNMYLGRAKRYECVLPEGPDQEFKSVVPQ